MIRTLAIVTTLALSSTSSFAAEVTIAKAAELGLHRIERLVTLKRIEENFLNKFYAVKIERIATGPTRFRFRGFQSPGVGGNSRQVEILMDEKGKAGTHSVIDGPEASAPAWPQKDPVTLLENAFHYILDNPARPELAPFLKATTEAALEQVQAGGVSLVIATFRSSASPKFLEITLKHDGTFVSAVVK